MRVRLVHRTALLREDWQSIGRFGSLHSGVRVRMPDPDAANPLLALKDRQLVPCITSCNPLGAVTQTREACTHHNELLHLRRRPGNELGALLLSHLQVRTEHSCCVVKAVCFPAFGVWRVIGLALSGSHSARHREQLAVVDQRAKLRAIDGWQYAGHDVCDCACKAKGAHTATTSR
eukprot:5455982-Prymnesium_polylepis.3